MKKIAFITDRAYPMYTGGYESMVYNLSQRLSDEYDVTVFTSMNEGYKIIGGVKYVKISEKYRFTNSEGVHNFRDSIRFALRVLKNANKFDGYDIVILNTIPYIFFGRLLNKLKMKKVSIFYEAWYDYISDRNMLFRFGLRHEIRSIVRNSDANVAVSSKTRESLIKNYGAGNVYLIPPGMHFENTSIEVSIKYQIVYLGRLVKIKHVSDLIESMKLVKDKFPSIRIAIAGDGEQGEELFRMSKELGLYDSMDFLGNIEENAKYSTLRSSKIFVLPSEREGFSISTMEAMYCGAVPVIAKPEYDEVFGTSDFVINNETGLYFRFGDIRDLADKITYLLENEEVYGKLQSNAISTARKYEWNDIVKMYRRMFDKL